jgi:hypothetical protein
MDGRSFNAVPGNPSAGDGIWQLLVSFVDFGRRQDLGRDDLVSPTSLLPPGKRGLFTKTLQQEVTLPVADVAAALLHQKN